MDFFEKPRKIKRRKKWKYTYDYNDKKFLNFVKRRTGIHFGEEEKPELAKFLLTSPKADTWLRKSKDFRYLNGKMVPFGKSREDQIRVQHIMRKRLQEQWDTYITIKKPRKIKRRKKVRKIKRRKK